MKQKLTLLILALFTAFGSWADTTVIISDKTDLDAITSNDDTKKTDYFNATEHKYGTYANASGGTTFTTNPTSGQSGLTITADGNFIKAYWYPGSANYKFGLAVTPATGAGNSATVTIKAPSGYYIKSYSMTAISTTSNGQFTLTPLGESGTNVTSSTITISPIVCANTATFTVTRSTSASGGSGLASELCFPSFTVTLASTAMSGSYSLDINSTTGDKYRDGESTPSTSTNDFRTYQSTSSPAGLKLVTGSGNSMNFQSTTGMKFHSNGGTYTLTAPSGYFIKGYKMSTYVSANKKNTIKPKEATGKILLSEESSNPTIICVDNINAASTTFVRAYETGGSADYAITTMTVYLEPTYTVTYNIKDASSNLWASYNQEVLKGTEITDLPALYKRAYCSYSMTSTTVTDNTSIDVTCTYDGLDNFVFASDVADATTNGKWMELKRSNNTNYVYYDGSALAYTASDLSTADGYQWAAIGNPYGYKLYNKGAEGYLNASIPVTNGVTTNDFTFNETGITFELYRYSGRAANDHFVSVVQGTNTNVTTATVLNEAGGTWKLWCGLNNTAGFYCDNGIMTGLSASLLLPFAVPTTFSVIYNINDGSGTTLATAVAEVAAADNGDDAANHMPASLNRTGCSYTYSPTTVSDGATINVTYTYDLGCGFNTYEDYSNITTWYFLKRNDTDYIVYASGETPNIQRSTDLPDGDNASWAFVGNPYEGFKVYNKGAGNSVLMVSDTPDTADGGESATVSLDTSGDVERWFLSTSGYFTNGIFFANSDNYKLNGRSGQTTVCYWTGGFDGGSTFVAIENVDYASSVTSELGPWFSTNVNEYFGLSQTTYDAQNANYTSYASSATYKQYMNLKAAVEAGINYPSSGLYRIRSNYTGYPDNTGKNYMNTTSAGLASVTNTTGEGVDVIMRLTNNGDGTYYIQAQGDYLQTPTQSAQVVRSTTPVAFTPIISTPGVVVWKAGGGQYGALHRASGNTLVGWEAIAAASLWTLDNAPASVSIALNDAGGGDYYATLYLPFDAIISGADAFTLAQSGDYLVPTEVVDNKVPAGIPVLLKGTAATATATINTGAAFSPIDPGALTGTYVDITTARSTGEYILGMKGDVVGFYQRGDGKKIGANKAYLSLGSDISSSVKGFVLMFDDDATGINSLTPALSEGEGAIYNVAGQRISKMQKGINIVNGKKILK